MRNQNFKISWQGEIITLPSPSFGDSEGRNLNHQTQTTDFGKVLAEPRDTPLIGYYTVPFTDIHDEDFDAFSAFFNEAAGQEVLIEHPRKTDRAILSGMDSVVQIHVGVWAFNLRFERIDNDI